MDHDPDKQGSADYKRLPVAYTHHNYGLPSVKGRSNIICIPLKLRKFGPFTVYFIKSHSPTELLPNWLHLVVGPRPASEISEIPRKKEGKLRVYQISIDVGDIRPKEKLLK